jgi:hypothetical protein
MFILDYVIYRIVAVILEMFRDKIVLALESRLYNTRGYISHKHKVLHMHYNYNMKQALPGKLAKLITN